MASLFALYSASHSFAVFTPPVAAAGAGDVVAGTVGAPPGIVSLPARQASTKSFFFSPEPLIASLFAAYSASHSFTVFADAGAPTNAIVSPIAAAGSK